MSYLIEIEPGKKFKHYWKELWQYRELLYILAWRDILVRYKQTLIGIFWALLKPLLTMVVFTIVFGKIASLPSDGIPYPILVMVASLPWQLFSNSLSESSSSLITNSALISKVYFPRIVIPISSIITSFVDFFISLIFLGLLMIYYSILPTWKIFVLPLFILVAIGASLGMGLWFSSLNVKYRDFRYIVPFVLQFGLFISPVGYSSNIIPAEYKILYSLNPMVGVIDGFRWAFSENIVNIYLPGLLISIFFVLLLLISGFWYFRKTEKEFADII